jgi:hypothetical protein
LLFKLLYVRIVNRKNKNILKREIMELVDFTNCEERINVYKGSEKKKTLIYNGKRYLVKFPDPLREKNKDISYINNAFSEYIGSKIFKISGFETQEVLLGIYNFSGKEKIVCACEDFTSQQTTLYEFENLTISNNVDKKIETEITDIIEVLKENSKFINSEETIKMFWKIFIIDALIGNTDRHNGNWGFIQNENMEIKFAPIYDCGSCLNPLLDDSDIEKCLNNKSEMKNLIVNTYSCLKENNKKINYISYITSLKNENCNSALLEVFEKIDLNKILNMIGEIDCISSKRRNFYKILITERYNIFEKVFLKLKNV